MKQGFLEYLVSVADHTFFWFGGIALVIIEALKKVPRTKEWAERLRWEFWAIAAICIFIATFQAWHEEFRQVEILNSTNAQLAGENKNLKQNNDTLTNRIAEKDRPIIVQAAPDPEVQSLLIRQDKELANLKNSLPSPKKRALQVSTDLLKFLAEREKVQPSFPMPHANMTTEEFTQQRDAFTQAYVRWMNETATECQTRFAIPLAQVLEDMKAENINVDNLASMCAFFNGNTFMIQSCATGVGVLAQKLSH